MNQYSKEATCHYSPTSILSNAVMEYTVIQLLWSSASVLFMYYLIDLLSIRKHTGHPLIGNSWKIAPRLKLNFDFFWDGTRLLQEGYQKARVIQLCRI